MSLTRFAAWICASALAASAQAPLPELKVEATDGGSALRIRNLAPQPLTAFLIELVGYPGSSFAYYHEGIGGRSVEPGAEMRIPITNMTVGAAPEYVKMQAALFAGGASAGVPAKIDQLTGLRRTRLETVRELIARIEAGKNTDKAAAVQSLEQWASSIPEPSKRERGTPAAVSRALQRELIATTAARLTTATVAEALAFLTAAERALASAAPAQ